MMKMNEKIILFIMMIIAIINMITAILILIMERTRMVGVFKAMGMPHFDIQRIFIYACMYIVFMGIFIGSVMGVSMCLLQQKFGLFTLDESTYYVKTVPVSIHAGNLLFIAGLTASVCFVLLLIPSFIIRHISPVKAIRFD
jgi:lipoprotein-releasing system permease protein